jgi:uncharacterized protein YhbP (UPF0306 family)
MDKPALINKIAKYLKQHNTLTLATVTPEGRPLAHTVEYVSDGSTLYIVTNKNTRKARNIMAKPDVAFTVDEDYLNWSKIQGVQMEARAAILTDKKEIDKASKLYVKKFPIVAGFPQNPDWVYVRIEPTTGFFLDYAKGFAHKDHLDF